MAFVAIVCLSVYGVPCPIPLASSAGSHSRRRQSRGSGAAPSARGTAAVCRCAAAAAREHLRRRPTAARAGILAVFAYALSCPRLNDRSTITHAFLAPHVTALERQPFAWPRTRRSGEQHEWPPSPSSTTRRASSSIVNGATSDWLRRWIRASELGRVPLHRSPAHGLLERLPERLRGAESGALGEFGAPCGDRWRLALEVAQRCCSESLGGAAQAVAENRERARLHVERVRRQIELDERGERDGRVDG